MTYQIIQTPSQLAALCEFLDQSATTLMLDTEFVRTRTYYAKLGLIQIFDGHQCFLVDPVLNDLDECRFWQRLEQHHWVLHAFGEDLEIIAPHVSQFGLSVFDTQIAASFLGHGISLGYQGLIQQTTGVLLDKGESRTDWLARPLTERQLDYAAKDVIYLKSAYEQQLEELKAKGLYDYVLSESARIATIRCLKPREQNAYLDVKNAWKLTRQQLAVLQQLAAWRLRCAIEKDMPVNKIVHADTLWAIAKYQPQTKNDLKNTGISPQAFRIHAQKLLHIVKQAQQISEQQWPDKIKRMIDYPDYKPMLSKFREAATEAEQHTGIPADVLAPKRLIHELFIWQWKLSEQERQNSSKPALISGWREEVLKPYLPTL